MLKFILMPAAVLALSCASQASAASHLDANASAHKVNLVGVDFRDQASVRALYKRIETAARQACASGWQPDHLYHNDAACVGDAVNRAVQTIDHPMLTALYQSSAVSTATATR